MATKVKTRRVVDPSGLRPGELIELIVYALEVDQGFGSIVTYNAQVPGSETKKLRQVDVLVETIQASRRFVRIVEVQNRARKVDNKFLDEVKGKMNALRAHRGTVVSTAGFTRDVLARVRAERHRLDAIQLVAPSEEEWWPFKRFRIGTETFPLFRGQFIDAINGTTIIDVAYGYSAPVDAVVCFAISTEPFEIRLWVLGDSAKLDSKVSIPLKDRLTDLHERVQKYTGPFDLPEPDDELSATIERIVEREMRNVPTR